ncbi:MAG: helix-turn-helix transcriptional regulator [Clostridiales bacterium]|jgi:transcriptional regulator with XRE-family HTH domain|nr:helix-turn-helix transcriptional regulator [Clostridiales bacterium]
MASYPVSEENKEKFIELGYNIAYYRKHAHLSQEELAEKTGISRTYLGSIEATNSVQPFSLEVLFRIASALDVEPYRLLMFHNKG